MDFVRVQYRDGGEVSTLVLPVERSIMYVSVHAHMCGMNRCVPILSCITHLEQPHCLYGIVRVESEAVVDASRDNDEVVFVDLHRQIYQHDARAIRAV